MSSKNIIRVSEFEKLYYDEAKSFQQRHWEVMCRYFDVVSKNQTNPFSPFRIINKGIQFLNYVGVLQAGNLTIEVLPKTDRKKDNGETENNKQQWHTTLLQMLAECKLLPVHHAGNALLKLRSHSILDIYLELFLDKAESLLHEGLLKQYQQQEGNKTTLKGQLSISRQVQQNAVHRERFYVRSSSYEADTIFNQILHKTIQLVAQVNNDVSLKERANRLLISFPPMSVVQVTAATFVGLIYNRKTERYKEAMQIAKMLLLSYRPDITNGTENVMAILFDMNALWEEWVYRRLKREEATYNITVLRQQSTDFWKGEHLPRHKTIRPDIVIKTADGKAIIIDTKWKLVNDLTPADDDLKQLFVYNLYWQCSQSILLYPATDEGASKLGNYVQLPQLGSANTSCRIMTQSIFKEGKIDADFGKQILEIALQKTPISSVDV